VVDQPSAEPLPAVPLDTSDLPDPPPLNASEDHASAESLAAVSLDNQPAHTSNSTATPNPTSTLEQNVPAPSGCAEQKRTTAKRVRDTSPGEVEDDASSSRPRKQPRTEATPSDDIPTWFLEALGMLEMPAWGPCWVKLLNLWSAFEKQESYTGVVRLSAKKRPDIIGMWIGRGRSVAWRPVISDLSAFVKEFREWWVTLQPDWRVSNGKLLVNAVDGDWEPLRRPGRNGLLSVLAALFYWGLAVNGKPGRRTEWISAVKDCEVVFQHLLS
jgi:hypothetical protein